MKEGSFPYGFSEIFIPQEEMKKRSNKACMPTFKPGVEVWGRKVIGPRLG